MQRFAELLAFHRETLIQRWERLVLGDPAIPRAQELSEPRLRDHVPALLDQFVVALRAEHRPEEEPHMGRQFGRHLLPVQHAFERFQDGYSLAAVLRELSHLRTTLVDLAFEHPGLDVRGIRFVHAAIDECMSVAAVEMEKAANEAVCRQQERLATVLHLLPVGVFIADAHGAELASNEAMRDFWSEDELAVRHVADYGRFVGYRPGCEVPLAAHEWPLAVALRTGSTLRSQVIDIVAHDGQRRTILSSSAPLLDPRTQEVTGGVAVIVDITDQVTAARSLQREAEMRERFLSVLAHDIRNPLNTVRLSAYALSSTPLTVSQSSYVAKIGTAVGTMRRMIEDLLDFTVARSGRIPVRPRAVDMVDVCREAVEQFRVTHPERSILFTSRGDGAGAWDPDRLAQVVGNLLGNALAYSPPGSPVRLDVQGTPSDVVLQVHNGGEPIAASDLPTLFEPFRRGANAEGCRSRGLGLGLFITKELVDAHGGRVTIESTTSEGTTFTVRLPRASSLPAEDPASS